MGSRKLDVVTARAVHLAMSPTFDVREAALELVEVSDGSWSVLTAARLRVGRALDERWSVVAARAADALQLAVETANERALATAS